MKNCIQQLKNYDRSKMKYPMLGQVKMDGIFARYDSNTNEFFTRAGNKVRGLTVLEKELEEFYQPLDGELIIPGLDFFTMNGLLRSFKEKPTCMFYVFDAPNINIPYDQRHEYYFDNLQAEHVRPMQAHYLASEDDADMFYDKVTKAGHEGVVYKSPDGMYRDGKHWENMKRTPTKTVECEILSAYEGLGKLQGMLGGFVVDFNGVEVKVGGGPGLDFVMRQIMWNDRDKAIGCMMKCSYKKTTPNGSMRSPQMLGLRWDI